LAIGLPRYYQLEARALRGLLEACECQPKGRQASVARELAALQQENARLQRELGRQQSLVRLAQRAVGLTPPPAAPAKTAARKGRRRRPTARALAVAKHLQLQAAAEETAAPDNSPAVPS
jgi:arylamine N-acetyltransferase